MRLLVIDDNYTFRVDKIDVVRLDDSNMTVILFINGSEHRLQYTDVSKAKKSYKIIIDAIREY
jgi:hypothetical protein